VVAELEVATAALAVATTELGKKEKATAAVAATAAA
jgi:hypothetical protein